jgi:inorganic pyrophosphatase
MLKSMTRRIAVVVFALPFAVLAQELQQRQLESLPAAATTRLAASLEASTAHTTHVWRDTPPINDDKTVNAYIEIARGDRRKWEFDMAANARKIDRMIPPAIGGYAVNYGYVPQTISSDGDPFDALVLGPPLTGGEVVRGVIVGLMLMEDEKGPDSKVVLSLVDSRGKPRHQLTADVQNEIAAYFKRYKQGQPGMFSKVPGWGTIADGLAHVTTTHAFFLRCRTRAGKPCTID